MPSGNTLLTSIIASAQDIAQWWNTARLVVETNSRPRQEKITGGRRISESKPPLDLTALDRLDEAETWARLCATACGQSWHESINSNAAANARYIIRNVDNLESLPDLKQWDADGRHAAYGIRKILGANDHTVMRATLLVARIVWKPDDIARILTDMLEQKITANTVSKARHDGRITIATDNTVSLEECATAIRKHDRHMLPNTSKCGDTVKAHASRK